MFGLFEATDTDTNTFGPLWGMSSGSFRNSLEGSSSFDACMIPIVINSDRPVSFLHSPAMHAVECVDNYQV